MSKLEEFKKKIDKKIEKESFFDSDFTKYCLDHFADCSIPPYFMIKYTFTFLM